MGANRSAETNASSANPPPARNRTAYTRAPGSNTGSLAGRFDDAGSRRDTLAARQAYSGRVRGSPKCAKRLRSPNHVMADTRSSRSVSTIMA